MSGRALVALLQSIIASVFTLDLLAQCELACNFTLRA